MRSAGAVLRRARDDERVGVVVETSQSSLLSKSSWLLLLLSSFTSSLSSSFSRYEKGYQRRRRWRRARAGTRKATPGGRSNPNEIFTSLTERESRLLLHRRLADIESFNVHDSKTFSCGSWERYRSERTHEF